MYFILTVEYLSIAESLIEHIEDRQQLQTESQDSTPTDGNKNIEVLGVKSRSQTSVKFKN